MWKHFLIAFVIASPPDPLAPLFDRVQRDPENAVELFRLAEKLRQRGRSEEAIERYVALLELQPNHKRAPQALGRLYLESGDCENATPLFTDLALKRGSDPEPKVALGRCAYRAGDYAGALAFFKQAESVSPRNAEIKKWLGLADLRNDQVEEAIESLNEAIKSDPNDRTVRLALILAAFRQKDPDLAQPHIDRYLHLTRKEPGGQADAELWEGVAEALRGRLPEATAKLESLHQRHPDRSVETLYLLGRLEYDRQDNDSAKRWFRTLLEKRPDSADSLFFLAAIEAREGDGDEAIRLIDKAIQRGFDRWGAFDDPAFDHIRLNEAFANKIPKLTFEQMEKLEEEAPGAWIDRWIAEWALGRLP